MTGIKRSSLYRTLEGNAALAQFVQKQPEAIHVEGRTRRLPPRWRVSMDNPIHPSDREQYDLLRAGKEIDRAAIEEEKRKSQIEIYEKRKSQIGISGGRKSQNGGRKSQNGGRKSQDDERKSHPGILLEEVSLPSGLFTKDSLPSATDADTQACRIPPINPPRGKEEEESLAFSFDPLQAVWNVALSHLAEIVNAPTLNAHLKPMRLASADGDEAILVAPTSFAKTWIEAHNKAAVEAALAEALGRQVTVKITAGGK